MQKELTDIIITLMESRNDYYDGDIVKGIESLRNNWPNLTVEEKKEIDAVVKALQIIVGEDKTEENKEKEQSYINNSFETVSKKKRLKKHGSILDYLKL